MPDWLIGVLIAVVSLAGIVVIEHLTYARWIPRGRERYKRRRERKLAEAEKRDEKE